MGGSRTRRGATRCDRSPAARSIEELNAESLSFDFWAGALAAMGDLEPAEVEQALHELARKELVRPARASSMEGEREYAFWHVLVRDVCYGQIPRLARADRHEAVAAWLEEQAGERVEDLADVLAYHYESALELTQAAGGDKAEQLQAQTVRYLAMAGARTLTLDVNRAEAQLSRALELAPDDDPMRAALLERWGNAVQQQGRLESAKEVLEQALDLYRAQGDPLGMGRVLTRLGNVTHRLGDPQCEELMAEAIEVLEAQPSGAELVTAYTYRARSVHRRQPEGHRGFRAGTCARCRARLARAGVGALVPRPRSRRGGRVQGSAPRSRAWARARAGT